MIRTRGFIKTAGSMLAIGFLILATGCEVPAAVAYSLTGKDKVDAVYALEKEQVTLLLVEGDRALWLDPNTPGRIASGAEQHLANHDGVKAEFVPQANLITLRERVGPEDWPKLGIARIGKALGAGQVIHARVVRSELGASDGRVFQPRAAVEVKVIETETGNRLFPVDELGEQGTYIDTSTVDSGYLLQVRASTQAAGQLNRDTAQQVERYLADQIALDLAQLFYSWEPDQAGDSFKNR